MLVTFEDCEHGLFWYGGYLFMKTAYGNNKGQRDAYYVEGGSYAHIDNSAMVSPVIASKTEPRLPDEAE